MYNVIISALLNVEHIVRKAFHRQKKIKCMNETGSSMYGEIWFLRENYLGLCLLLRRPNACSVCASHVVGFFSHRHQIQQLKLDIFGSMSNSNEKQIFQNSHIKPTCWFFASVQHIPFPYIQIYFGRIIQNKTVTPLNRLSLHHEHIGHCSYLQKSF